MVVAYKMGGLTFSLLSRLVKTPYIALPNLLANRELVPEYIQDAAEAKAIAEGLAPLLAAGSARQETLDAFQELHVMLKRDAGESAANAIALMLESKHGAD
jgi:lipid-A-disaccharide synthase